MNPKDALTANRATEIALHYLPAATAPRCAAEIFAAITAAVDAEREACAKIADLHDEKAEQWYLDGDGDPALVKESITDWKACAVEIASDIRARQTS